MKTDDFLGQIREGQVKEEALKKYLGTYRTKDVDQYIEKLLSRIQSMEAMYNERYDEMRTNIFGITKERDEQIEKVKALQEIVKDTSKYLEKKGLIALSKEEYNAIKSAEEKLKHDLSSLNEKQKTLKNENEKLSNELNEKQRNHADIKDKIKIIEQLNNEINSLTKENDELKLKFKAQKANEETFKGQIESAVKEAKDQAKCLKRKE
ncbi:MAG: hypothetical protein R2876_04105 [Eubacteriales bacterium]